MVGGGAVAGRQREVEGERAQRDGDLELDPADLHAFVRADHAAEPPALLAARPPGDDVDDRRIDREVEVADGMHVELESIAASDDRRGTVGDDDHRSAGAPQGVPRRLRDARMVEHAPRHDRRRIVEREHAEAARRAVLEPAQHLDVMPDQLGLVRLSGVPPLVEGGEVGRRDALVEGPLLETVMPFQSLPVEVGPVGRVDEVGRVRHRLRPELRHEPHDPRHRRRQPFDVAHVAVVPAEVEVAVGPVEQREMGQHARVRHDQTGGVGALERSSHPAVEHGLVPGRQLLGGEIAQARLRAVTLDPDRRCGRLVVSVPLHDRRVMTE